ncbi:MAG: type II/IV secretion system protein, partial [Pirellulaceae bacterium]
MNQPNRDYTDLLLSKGIISLEQLTEAVKLGKSEDKSVGEALVALGYATPEEVTRALAKFNKVEYVDLTETRIADEVIQLVPESVARENANIPISEDSGTIRVLISNPFDIE